MSTYKAAPISRHNIRMLAKHIRRITGYEDTLYFPIVEFVELILPNLIPDFEFEVKPHEDMDNKCGETKPSENRIIINEDIYNNAIEGDGFARLTLAHEVGHLLMHDIDSISLCRLKPGERLKAYEDPEWQADAFGGELLASCYLIRNMSITEIAEKCGVTLRAASVQKSKL